MSKEVAITPANMSAVSFNDQLTKYNELTGQRTQLKEEVKGLEKQIVDFINKNRKHFQTDSVRNALRVAFSGDL